MRKLKTRYVDLDKNIMVGTFNNQENDFSDEDFDYLFQDILEPLIESNLHDMIHAKHSWFVPVSDNAYEPRFSFPAFLVEECKIRHIRV
jgi:hypothetical protein